MKGASASRQKKRIPLGSMVFASRIREADFKEFLLKHLGEGKEQSAKTYIKIFRKLMTFAEKNKIPPEEIVSKPEEFLFAYIKEMGLGEDKARIPRSIFLKHVYPFLKEKIGEQEEKEKKPEKPEEAKEMTTGVTAVEKFPKEAREEVLSFSEEGKREIVVALLSMVGTVAGDIKTLSFPSLMLLKEGDYMTYFVALEKVDEDPLTLKLRGFYLEDWVEKIMSEKRRRKTIPHHEERKELVEPSLEVVGIFKKDIVKFVELEPHHEHSRLLEKLQPFMEKIKDRFYEELRYGRGGARF